MAKDEQNAIILEKRNEMSHHMFKYDQWPLFDVKAYRISDDTDYLFFGCDSLIIDGASMSIFQRELMELYNHPEIKLDELEFTFRDYITAYKEFKNSSVYAVDREYWLNKLEDFPLAPAMPLKQDPSAVTNPHFKRLEKIFSREEWRRIKKIAGQNKVTPSALVSTAYAEVLGFWSNQPKFAINLTVFNRYPFHEDVEKIIGDFTSVILVDVDLSSGGSFIDRAKRLQDTLLEALQHRHYEGVEFIREISKYNNLGNRAAMPVVFTSMIFDSAADENADRDEGSSVERLGDVKMSISQTPQVYLDHQVSDNGGQLLLVWDYVEELFDREVIEQMFKQYIGILSDLTETGNPRELDIKAKNRAIQQYI